MGLKGAELTRGDSVDPFKKFLPSPLMKSPEATRLVRRERDKG